VVAPLAAIALDARVQDQVVVACAGNLERIELEQAHLLDGGEHALAAWRQ
jgi:hypothetical protein